ncbi:prepilin-type N-terminal cleavage/methylation domain-containing protein [Deinococcus cellulosilyticus]|uniref:Uncharacterized protein n=1 Tax=Deinococcus cellulosilyticus (strain DSM 18568 / NBRC 106333 / KACC 11606 / 5516J-15) TaxID=1223518 RepID=A0A511N9A6_DEIC1|nr:prepilin-type N-terminal cleavage/methylation domain-containing protein [Deinococcus cellulosilyticus]GEM49127.1 hypothetical protein DC3_47620 [Deinococcus cellulosilyticus NBRC 106333 = KACC 11606]
MKKTLQKGLTLIEVLVSLVILLLLATMTLNVIPLSKINRQALSQQTLTLGVKQYMESVSSNWQTRTTFDAGTLPDTASLASGFTCTAAVSDPDNIASGVAVRKRVTLTCKATGWADSVFITEFGRP